MTTPSTTGPILACYDGSDGSKQALTNGGLVLGGDQEVVVLVVWQTLATQLAVSGSFRGVDSDAAETEVDSAEEQAAQAAADEAVALAKDHGRQATSRVERAGSAIWKTIADVADEVDASVILCGTRGRGSLTTALLGSTSQGVLHHTRRPVLVVPEPHH